MDKVQGETDYRFTKDGLVAALKERGYTFQINGHIEWNRTYEAASICGFAYCSRCDKWFNKNDFDVCFCTDKENDYDVHFQISGFFQVSALNKVLAREKIEKFLRENINQIEDILCTGVADDSYTTDVIAVK